MRYMKILIYLIILIPIHVYGEISLFPVEENMINGKFNVIIYSNSYINDPETFIIFDKTDDNIDFSLYAPSFKFKVIPNLKDTEALKISREILYNSSSISSFKYTEIKISGITAGFEIKPVYFPWIFGILEPVETVYKKKNNSIEVFIRLNPRVERQINNGGNSDKDD